MCNPKTLFFINNQKTKILKNNIITKTTMSTKNNINRTIKKPLQSLNNILRRYKSIKNTNFPKRTAGELIPGGSRSFKINRTLRQAAPAPRTAHAKHS